jgi:uncharacterized membrane protein YedE/YeeE
MIDFLTKPWPWYFGGFMIALVLFLLIWVGKSFGMSSNLRTLCSMMGAGKKASFFQFDWKAQQWNLIVSLGVIAGGFIASNYITTTKAVALTPQTIDQLAAMGITDAGESFAPELLFSNAAFSDPYILLLLVVGGFLVGFGARYAGGCTSGHAISGLSNLQWPSLIAVIGFFIGGLLVNHFVLPFLFNY